MNIETEKNEMPLEERFWSKVNKRNLSNCWEWDAFIGQDGYGQFWFKGRTEHAHRVAWMLRNKSPIPKKMVILHTCDNKRCVNPLHLKLGTYSENAMDYLDKFDMGSLGRECRFYKEEIWLMKRLYSKGISQRIISKIFKTVQGQISGLISGKKGLNAISYNGGN